MKKNILDVVTILFVSSIVYLFYTAVVNVGALMQIIGLWLAIFARNFSITYFVTTEDMCYDT